MASRRSSMSSGNSQKKADTLSIIGEPLVGKEALDVVIKVRVGTVDLQKRMSFPVQQKVWDAKLTVLSSFTAEILGGFNYGFFILPANNRAGKFLDDERTFKAYNLDAKASLEFKYKKRVYRQMNIDFAQVRKNHTKSNLRLLLDSIRHKDTTKLEKLLTEKYMDPNFIAESTGGETPLTLAATIEGSQEVIKVLVANGAHLDFRNKFGQTVLHKAAEMGNPKNLELLLDLGASPNYRDPKGLTPAYYCVMHSSDPACLSILVKNRAELDVADDKGWRELHQACRNGLMQHIETLLSYYADLDAQNEAGNTPLHVCASYNQAEAARILLFRGADKTVKNQAHITAYQVAIVSSNNDLAENIKNFAESQVVRIQEEPVYKPRRGVPSSSPSATLKRTSSEPSLAKESDRISLKSKSSANSVPYDRRDSGSSASYSPMSHHKTSRSPSEKEYVAIQNYQAQEENEISLQEGDIVEVLSVSNDHYWEGRAQGDVGWFPSYLVREATKQQDEPDAPGMKNNRNAKGTHLNNALFEPRAAVLSRGKKGFGFVLRGAKSPKNPGVEFVPTREFPALQYLESVDKGSPADKEGLLQGDFLLEINGEDVRCAPHQQVVHMVLTAPDTLLLKVVTAPNPRTQETLSKLGTPPVSTAPTPVMTRTPVPNHHHEQPFRDDQSLPGSRTIQRPNHPPPPPNKFNTVARIHSVDRSSSHSNQDMATDFELDIADGRRRPSVGSDSAVSSSRSSPASTHSYATTSSTSGTDSGTVSVLHDRTTSDPGVRKPLVKKSIPPPPLRSSSLPAEDNGVPTPPPPPPAEEPKSGFAAAIAAAASKRKISSTVNGHPPAAEKSAFQMAMEAKERNMRGESVPQGGPHPVAASGVSDDGSSLLLEAIKRRQNRMQSQDSRNGNDIESKIKTFKKQSSSEHSPEDALAVALAKRRSKVDTETTTSSDESTSPVRSLPMGNVVPPPPPPVDNSNTHKPSHKPPPPPPARGKPTAGPPTAPKKKAPPPVLKKKPPEDTVGILPPPASYSDGSLERGGIPSGGPGRFHSLERGSISSSQSSLSTVSTMSTDPSSIEGSEGPGERQEAFNSTNSLQSSSSTSSSVVTVKSTSDHENDNDGTQQDRNLINQQNDSSKPVKEWSREDVSAWLRSINMADYTNNFLENDICGEHLLTLTKEDLVELGVTRLGHKKTIMGAIGKLS